MARQPQNPRYGAVIPRPAASPVDTYARPGPTAGSQLAEALAEVSPNVRRFSNTLAERDKELQRQAGEKKARELMEEGLSYAEALRQGKIDPTQSPFYLAALKEQSGRVAADKWEAQLRLDVSRNDDLKNAMDIEAFDKFAMDHRAKWLKDNAPGAARDGGFEKGFGTRADAYYFRERSRFVDGLATRVKKVATDQHFAEVNKSARDTLENGGTVDDVARDIENMFLAAQARGDKREDLYAATIEAVVAAARETENPEMLDILSRVRGYGETSLADSKHAKKIVEDARDRIYDQRIARIDRAHTLRNRAREQRRDRVLAEAAKAKLSNPESVLDMGSYIQAMEGDHIGIEALKNLVENMDVVDVRTHQETYHSVLRRLYEPGEGEAPLSNTEVLQLRGLKLLSNKDTEHFLDQIDKAKKRSAGERDEIYNHPALREALSNITAERFSDGIMSSFAGGMTVDQKHAARVTVIDAFLRNYDWLQHRTPEYISKWTYDHAVKAVQEQRGGTVPGIASDGKTPKPKLMGKAPKDLVLTEEQLAGFLKQDREQYESIFEFTDKYELAGEARLQWVRDQVRLFTEKNMRAPGQPLTKKQEE